MGVSQPLLRPVQRPIRLASGDRRVGPYTLRGLGPLVENPTMYTVKRGDTPSKIAAKQRRSLAALLAANPRHKANPNAVGATKPQIEAALTRS